MQKYVINRFLQWNSLIFSKFSSNNRICMFLHCNGPKLPKYENSEKSRLDGDFIGKQCLYYWIQRRNTFRTWFCHRKHVFSVKITFCTLFSLLQLIKRFRPYIVKNRKLTLFSRETLTKVLESVQKYVINRFLQWNSLIFSKFYSNNRVCMVLHSNGPKLPKYENSEKSRLDGDFIGKQCL